MENRKWGVRIMEAKKYRRIFTIVVDSCGIGGAKDAERFGDAGTDTLGHIAETVGNLSIPNMQKLGIANLKELNIAPVEKPMGYFTKLSEASNGKDTMTGHWEMMGLHITKPFLTFTEHGFPKELIDELEKRTGHKVIGNKSASGTEILEELGEEEIATGHMIVYTSADSVLQICGNEETFGLKELYRCCEIAREITMKDEWKVGRVIARPYVGKKKGEFVRTSNRHDYALKPYGRTALNALKDAGYDVISVGKIRDIFDGEGITESNKSKSSVHGMEQTIEIAERDFTGLCFVNLVDFDALWGHRRNVKGYAEELERFDVKLGELLKVLREDDLLIITADHGNDPTYKGTDHTREQVMFVAYSPSMKGSGKLEDQDTFAVIGATIADNFGVQMPEGTIGTSLLAELK
jgi:phosphopentomutase